MDADHVDTESRSEEALQKEHWAGVAGLTCILSVDLRMPGFKVRDLLTLGVETVVESHHNASGQVPVWVNGVMIGWAEFDVVRTRVAIRISELG
jgi:flagellar motor switch/type III secretory pathway protein FliN